MRKSLKSISKYLNLEVSPFCIYLKCLYDFASKPPVNSSRIFLHSIVVFDEVLELSTDLMADLLLSAESLGLLIETQELYACGFEKIVVIFYQTDYRGMDCLMQRCCLTEYLKWKMPP